MDFVIRECDREVAEVLDAFLNALVSEFNALQLSVEVFFCSVIFLSHGYRPAPAKSASLY